MATNYCEKLQAFGAGCQELGGLSPDAMGGFMALHHATCEAGAPDSAQRELLALAISIAIHCDDCIAYHTQAAMENGATDQDMLTVLDVAILMGGGPGVVYSTHALEAMKQFKAAAESVSGR